uniref:Mitochondrial inner membrane protein Mpv17 n=2 Tax=Schistocephalus solidus TaxID=70667 RepID=A0A0X3PAP2_SCHSO
MVSAVFNKAWSGYLRLLKKYPLQTQCISTAIIMSSGDIIAQKIVERQPTYSPSRTLKFGMIGMCFVGPTFHYWYNFIDRIYTGTKVVRSLKMVASDQFLMAPCMVFSIIGLVGLTKNWSIDEAKTGLKDNYIRAMFMNIRVGPKFSASL